MAFDVAYMENPRTGQMKAAPVGFSWTMFFFGFFPTLFRGDWKWFGVTFGGGLLLGLISAGFLGWVPSLVGAFIWNKSHLNGLVADGFQVKTTRTGNMDGLDQAVGMRVPRLE